MVHIKVLFDLVGGKFRECQTGKKEGREFASEEGTKSRSQWSDVVFSAFDCQVEIVFIRRGAFV